MRTEQKIIVLRSVLKNIELKIKTIKITHDIFLCHEISQETRNIFPEIFFRGTEAFLKEHFEYLFDHKPTELLRNDQSWWNNDKESLYVRKNVILKLIEKYESILIKEQSEQQNPD